MRLFLALAFGLAVVVMGSGCAELGGVSDGTSLARGYVSDGALINGSQMPGRGNGYMVPLTWRARGNQFGTDELVGLIVRAAARVAKEDPGSMLYLGDMSPRNGGASIWHKSHQNGRDADLIFFALNANGKPAAPPPTMYRYGGDGWTVATPGVPRLRFDVDRNWLLVRALVEDGAALPQYLFISVPLRALLLDHARDIGEPQALIEAAAALLVQPTDSLAHDDHLHLRILCPLDDRSLGCRDRGPLRWGKKLYKYLSLAQLAPTVCQVMAILTGHAFCRLGNASPVSLL